MRVRYDEKSDALYIRFSEKPCHKSDEIKEGFIIDYDKKGKVIGIEILDVSENMPKETISKISFETRKAKAVA